MYLKCHLRFKDGKEHRDFSLAEKRRCAAGPVTRPVLYLGELNDSQKESWLRCIQAFDVSSQQQTPLALFPADRPLPDHAAAGGVQVRLAEFSRHRPRQWGACWIFCQLWHQLQLDPFWSARLPPSRQGTSWYHLLRVLCAYRLIDPGSEWRLHRLWFEQSAMGDRLGEDFGLLAKDNLYRALDHLLAHKEEMFGFLRQRWQDLFGVTFDVLLYDLTRTCFESDPLPHLQDEKDKRRFGYSRDHRPDCVQVVIALIVTPEGFPLAYEVLSGHTADKTTLRAFLEKIQARYGKARRIWVMDRGIPTEEVLAEMRAAEPPVLYVVGTPKGRLSQLEKALLERPWQEARPGVQVKLLPQEKELYVRVQSQARVSKERAMRRRRLKTLWHRLGQLQKQRPSYERLLLPLGAAKKEAGRAWSLVKVQLPDAPPKSQRQERVDFTDALAKKKLREVWGREGRYLLRSNLVETGPARPWEFYLQRVEVEAAFKNLKGELAERPIFHQKCERIEGHIFVAFLAYSEPVTLRAKLRLKAPGLTVRQVLDQLGAMQMLDVHFPTTAGRELIFTRYTQPEKDQQMLQAQLGLNLPEQAAPKIGGKKEVQM